MVVNGERYKAWQLPHDDGEARKEKERTRIKYLLQGHSSNDILFIKDSLLNFYHLTIVSQTGDTGFKIF